MFCFVFWNTALAYKGIDYEYRVINLVKDGGEQVLFMYGFLHHYIWANVLHFVLVHAKSYLDFALWADCPYSWYFFMLLIHYI